MNANVNKTNGVKLFALVAIVAMLFAGVAVVMSDNSSDAATTTNNGTTYLSGDITATQNFGDGTNVVVNGELTIPSGMALIISGTGKLTVESGASIIIEAGGQLILQDTALVTINGNITAQGTAGSNYAAKPSEGTNTNAPYYAAIVNNVSDDPTGKTGVYVSGTITLERGAELTNVTNGHEVNDGNGTLKFPAGIPSDIVSEVPENGAITLLNGATIDVTQRSRTVSEIGGQDIYMNVGATLKINGNITDTLNVKATGTGAYYTAGAITLDKTDNTYADAGSSDLTITVTNQNIQALTDRDDENSNITLRQYILNVDGTLANNESLEVTGGTSNIVKDKVTTPNTPYYETTGYNYVIFPIVSINGSLEVAASSDFTVDKDNQVNVSGTLTFVYDEDLATYDPDGDGTDTTPTDVRGTVLVSGSMYITGTVNGAYYSDEKYSSFKLDQMNGQNSNRIVVDGGSIALETTVSMDDFLKKNSTGSRIYGSMYVSEAASTKDPDTIYIVDFDDAVAGAVAAESDSVYVFAFGAQQMDTADDAAGRGAFVVESDITIPDGMTVTIWNALVVSENATLTVEEGATIDIVYDVRASDTPGVLWVDGKVVDYDGCLGDYEGTEINVTTDNGIFMYEVKKTTDTDSEYYITYTTLAIAISEAQAGEEIQLNGVVTVDENLTIPEQVTVIADGDVSQGVALHIEDATLTVNGVLDMNGMQYDFTDGNKDGDLDGSIVVNNFIVNVNDSNYGEYEDLDSKNKVAGAYFNGTIGEDYVDTNFIASVAVAAQASTTTDRINIFGNVAMGDVTFTASEDEALTVYIYNDDKTEAATAGTVTLSGVVTLNTYNGEFTGTVAGADATIYLNGNKDMTVQLVPSNNGETITYEMQIASMTYIHNEQNVVANTNGTIEIRTGTVYITDAIDVDMLTVADGAAIVIDGGSLTTGMNPGFKANTIGKQLPLLNESVFSNAAGLVVNGTLTIGENGTLNSDYALVNGTLSVADNATSANIAVSLINGTVDIAEGKSLGYNLMVLNGAVNGVVNAVAYGDNTNNIWGMIVAYPGSTIDANMINYNGTSSDAVSSVYYVNGTEYATVYGTENIPIDAIILLIDIADYDEDTAIFYSDAEMKQQLSNVDSENGINDAVAKLDTTTLDNFMAGLQTIINAMSPYNVGDYPNVYIGMDPSSVAGTITTYQGMNVYIDGMSLSNIPRGSDGKYLLDVGAHTIEIQLDPGLVGTTSITLNGQAVTGGSFEITGDMTSFQIVVSGDVSYDIGSSDSGNDGMGLTDYLLIILVVLIVIMAIMVAMRLMRS